SAPTPLAVDRAIADLAPPPQAPSHGVLDGRLTAAATAELAAFARSQQVTLNTLVQGAWALLLGRYSGAGSEGVVFGAVTWGRSAPLAGIEGIAGLFINTLPARIAVSGAAELAPWLHEIQQHQAEVRNYEHSPLYQVRSWSEIPAGQ